MNDEDNFFGDIDEGVDLESVRSQMLDAMRKLETAEAEAEQLEEALRNKQSEVNEITTKTFPDLLRQMATDLWRDPVTGKTVELVPAVRAQQPKDMTKRIEMFEALKELGIYDIVGQEFVVTFTPGDRRALIVRKLLGLEQSLFDDSVESESGGLTNYEVEAIWTLRNELGLTQEDLPANETAGVHPARFKSWLLKKIQSGHGAAVSEAGIWHGDIARVSEPKTKKGKS